jgi:hypothetical protein
MKIVDIIREDESGRDPRVMADWLRTAGATGSEAAKDQNVISKSIAIYSARKELSPDEAFSIAKNQVYGKKNNNANQQKTPFASASHDYKSAMDKKSKLQRGFNEPSHSHLRKQKVGNIELPDFRKDDLGSIMTKGSATGKAIGDKVAKTMKGTYTARNKPTLS